MPTAEPSPKPRRRSTVGLVERQSTTLFHPPNDLLLEGGRRLGPITVAFETVGTLSPEKDNAIFVCHALTGDAHIAGKHHPDDRKPGWWEGFVGPGKGIDTDRYFVICANTLGGCRGTTGPGSINPETGEPWGPDFPFITVADVVRVYKELVDSLGIRKLLAVVGGSLGGMQVLEWAVRFPESMHAVVALASGPRLNAQGIAFNAVGRRAIFQDRLFREGRYYNEDEKPRFGLALARMIAHITYLSEQSIEMKFGRKLQHSDELAYDLRKETEFQIESYLHYQGTQFVERFDANSYLLLTRAMDYFNLEEAHGPLDQALGRTDARFFVASYTTDWLFPTSQSKEIVRALLKAGQHVTFTEFDSPFGHDAFLIDSQLGPLAAAVSPFLERTLQDVRQAPSREATV